MSQAIYCFLLVVEDVTTGWPVLDSEKGGTMCDSSGFAVLGLMLPPALSIVFYSNLKWLMGSAAPSVGFAPIPSSVKNVDKNEIEMWMSSFGSLAETESVGSFDLKPLDGHFSCEVNRLKIVIKDSREGIDERELSIILKKPKETLFHKVMFAMLGLVQRETGFYEYCARHPEVLQGIRVPKVFFSANDAAGDQLCLLEDLAPAHPIDCMVGVSRKQASQVIRELARLHARFWNPKALADITFTTPLRAPDLRPYMIFFSDAYRRGYAATVKLCGLGPLPDEIVGFRSATYPPS